MCVVEFVSKCCGSRMCLDIPALANCGLLFCFFLKEGNFEKTVLSLGWIKLLVHDEVFC